MLGPRQLELVEEDLRERFVVVLAGVDEDLAATARSGPETAAALMNCGRFPITVSTRSFRGAGARETLTREQPAGRARPAA